MANNKKILIIEDDAVVMAQIKNTLEKENYDVVEAKNGVEGLEKIQSERPDLVFLDMHLPDKNGLSFLEELEEYDIKLNIIGISSNFSDGEHNFFKESYEHGVNDFLEKPVEKSKLKVKLDKFFPK